MKVLCVDKGGATLSLMLETAIRTECARGGLTGVEIDSGGIDFNSVCDTHEFCFWALVVNGLKPEARFSRCVGFISNLSEYRLIVCSTSEQKEAIEDLVGNGPEVIVANYPQGLIEPEDDSRYAFLKCVKDVILSVPNIVAKIREITETSVSPSVP